MRALVAAAVLVILATPSAIAGSGPPRQGVVTDAGRHGAGAVGEGASLYAANCSSCHGSAGRGVPTPTTGAGAVEGQGPSLRNVGALAADFYLRTGYMPLEDPHSQPARSRPLFSEQEIRAMVAYVATLGDGPAIPNPQPQQGDVGVGRKLFLDHCAGCHQIAAEGGYVTGARVPPLTQATDRQIAEAIRVGPYLMPHFSERQLDGSQVNSLIAYIDYARHPDDAGGWAIGRIGPVPEGIVAWLLAGSALVAACLAIGRRLTS
jgi:ubiquinol-cytochrome c reductase cytochrome c subunit